MVLHKNNWALPYIAYLRSIISTLLLHQYSSIIRRSYKHNFFCFQSAAVGHEAPTDSQSTREMHQESQPPAMAHEEPPETPVGPEMSQGSPTSSAPSSPRLHSAPQAGLTGGTDAYVPTTSCRSLSFDFVDFSNPDLPRKKTKVFSFRNEHEAREIDREPPDEGEEIAACKQILYFE